MAILDFDVTYMRPQQKSVLCLFLVSTLDDSAENLKIIVKSTAFNFFHVDTRTQRYGNQMPLTSLNISPLLRYQNHFNIRTKTGLEPACVHLDQKKRPGALKRPFFVWRCSCERIGSRVESWTADCTRLSRFWSRNRSFY